MATRSRVQRSRSPDWWSSPTTALTAQPTAPTVSVVATAGHAGRVVGSTWAPTAPASAAMPTTCPITATWPSTAVARGWPTTTATSPTAAATTAVVAVDQPSDEAVSSPANDATTVTSHTRPQRHSGTRARPTATATSAAIWAPS